jgi:hypothetical protein
VRSEPTVDRSTRAALLNEGLRVRSANLTDSILGEVLIAGFGGQRLM